MTDTAIAEAATVVVVRDGADGLEALLLRRAASLAFHGGAWVFPGGRVEAEEGVTSASALDRARVAALRETHEEAGLTLSAEELVPLSHWTTPPGRARRFATWFFVGAVDRAQEVRVDGGEIDAFAWLTPHAALRAQREREIDLPPPTFVTLTLLAQLSLARDVVARARGEDPFFFVPRPRVVEGGIVSLYGGDAAYEGAALEVEGPRHRLLMLPDGWRYHRDL